MVKKIIKVGFNTFIWSLFVAPSNYDYFVDEQVKILKSN